MIAYISTILFVGAHAAQFPAVTSGAGVTQLSGHQVYNVASFGPNSGSSQRLCQDDAGNWWADGSSFRNTNINQVITCRNGNWDYQQTCQMVDRQYCWTYCAHNFGQTCQDKCRCTRRRVEERLAPIRRMNSCPSQVPFNGDRCYSHGLFCQYNTGNFICQNSKWTLQGNPQGQSCWKNGQWYKDGHQNLNKFGAVEWSCQDGQIRYNQQPTPQPTPKPSCWHWDPHHNYWVWVCGWWPFGNSN